MKTAVIWFQEGHLGELWRSNPPSAWLWLLAAVLLGLLAGKLAAALLTRIGIRFARRGWNATSSLLLDLLGPARLALLTSGLAAGMTGVHASGVVRIVAVKSVVLLFSSAAIWYLFNLCGVVDLLFTHLPNQPESLLDRQLAPLVRKTLRTFLLVLASLFLAQSVFEQDIGAWLAGLGIAGLALSLAAQDSLKNLFGSITILLDRPFQIGDRIVFGTYEGVIEDIGFRSTTLRSLAGHVITIPNSKIASEAVENITRRPYIRRSFNLLLPHDTPTAKVAQALEILRAVLEEDPLREPIHPTIDGQPQPPRVYLSEFSTDNLTINIMYWYTPPRYWQYMIHAEQVNLRIHQRLAEAEIRGCLPADQTKGS